ncbi:MAG: sodium:solute symporter family protein [Thermoguttaceae bacterium]
MHLSPVDFAILIIYTLFVLGIGFALKRFMKSSTDFFLSGRAIPAWITGLAFISANLGALELVGMAASGAKYGMLTCHFYWIGAIPAMVFLGIFMMPFYYGSKARSVPEYLKLRFDEKTRAFNAISFAVMTIFTSGISLYILALIISPIIGVSFSLALLISAVIVLVYIYLGGLTSAIYNEVLQFFLIVLGFLPVVLLGLRDMGGWHGLVDKINGLVTNPNNLDALHRLGHDHAFPAGTWTNAWTPMLGPIDKNPMGIDLMGMVMGLGFVLSFGYWCTNFLVVQRAMAANSMSSARRTPLIGAIPKMLFPVLVILPGLIAVVAGTQLSGKDKDTRKVATLLDEATATFGQGVIPPKTKDLSEYTAEEQKKIPHGDITRKISGGKPVNCVVQRGDDGKVELDYNMATANLLAYYCPMGLLGLGLTALLASFMSGMAGNVTAFNSVWTYDIYQSYFAPNRPDAHYLWMGRAATLFGILASIGAAYLAAQFNNIMDAIQLVFSFVNAPLFATFLLGMFWKRTTGHGAFWGLVLGTVTSALCHGLTIPEVVAECDVWSKAMTAHHAGLVKGGWISWLTGTHPLHEFYSAMALNFWMAIFAFSVCFVLTIVFSLLTRRKKSDEDLRGLVYSLTPHLAQGEEKLGWYEKPLVLAAFVLAVTVVLNYIFW